MTKILKDLIDEGVLKNVETFSKKTESEMLFNSSLTGDSLDFEWVDVVTDALPYLDNIVRNPKLTLITEQNIEKIEKTKKVTVETVKDLSKHTYFIDRIDEKTGDVIPSKLLDIRGIDTFNTYENRVIYTLLDKLERFVKKRLEELENFEMKNEKTLEFASKSKDLGGKYNIEMKIEALAGLEGDGANPFQNQIKENMPRIEKIRKYQSVWRKSEFTTVLKKERAAFVRPPFTKTNIIIKNPNFQVAMKLWTYLSQYDSKETEPEDGNETNGDDIILGLLNHSFTIDYMVLNCISKRKREQKNNLKKVAGVLVKEEVKKIIELLFSLGIKITDEELLALFSEEIQKQKSKQSIGEKDIKDKFKNAMDEYIERTQEYL